MLQGYATALSVPYVRPRVTAVVAAATVGETAVRCLVVSQSFALAILLPPLVAGPLLGASIPRVRTMASHDESVPGGLELTDRVRDRGAALLASVVAGHLVAVALGVALFLLVDTPLKYAYYALGLGPVAPLPTLVLTLTGVGVGTVLAWIALVPTLGYVADGAPVRTAFQVGARDAVAGIRSAGIRLLGVLAVAVAVAVLPPFLVLRAVPPARFADQTVLATVGLTGTVLTAVAWFVYPVVVARTRPFSDPTTPDGETWGPTVARGVVVCVMVGALVVGAAGVRATETRPGVDGSTTSLPDDPTAAYATALENTRSGSFVLNTTVRSSVIESEERGPTVYWHRVAVDRSDRQTVVVSNLNGASPPSYLVYGDMGVLASGSYTRSLFPGQPSGGSIDPRTGVSVTRAAIPTYPYAVQRYRDRGSISGTEFVLPAPSTGEWTVVDRGDGTMTLALTGEPVFAALGADWSDSVTYETAVIRIRVDTDRGVITGGRYRVNGTVGDTRLERSGTYDVSTGEAADVERPEWAGSPGLAETIWKTLAY